MTVPLLSSSKVAEKQSGSKLPFLRGRPAWSRRSLAGAGGASGPSPTADASILNITGRQTSSGDSGERPYGTGDTIPFNSSPGAGTAGKQFARGPDVGGMQGSRLQGHAQRELRIEKSNGAGDAKAFLGPMTVAGLVENSVKRIVAKLPAHSSSSAASLEQDEVIRHATRSLCETSKRKLSTVLQPIVHELDALTKPPYFNPDTDFVSVDLLRTQLFLLRLVSSCTLHYWVANSTPERRARRPVPSTPTKATLDASTSSTVDSLPFLDPPPIDEQLAKRILDLCLSFLKSHLQPDDFTGPHGSSSGTAGGAATNSFTGSRSIAEGTQAILRQISTSPAQTLPVTGGELPTTRQLVSFELFRVAGWITYFISSSNWSLVFSKIKSRAAACITTAPSGVGYDDPKDLVEVRLLEWTCFDRRKLTTVIQEFCNTFIHFKRPHQATVCVILRRSIWAWIESFPSEFNALNKTNRRLEGGPEVLFDIVHTLSESSKRKNFAWPFMIMLLVCCPDILAKLAVGEGVRGTLLTKKVQFFETLRKSLRSSTAEVSAAAFVDLCRAATFTEPDTDDPSALRLLVADLETDLKARLCDATHPFATSDGILDLTLTTRALVSLYRINPRSITQLVLPSLLAPSAAEPVKMAAVHAILEIVGADGALPWFENDVALKKAVARPLRIGFLTAIGSRTLDQWSPIVDEASYRSKLIRCILNIYLTDMRYLTYDMEAEADSLPRVALATSTLLEEPNCRAIRTLALKTLLELYRSSDEQVGVVRDSSFDVHARSVSAYIARHVLESKNGLEWERDALELLLFDLMRYQALFQAGSSAQATALMAQPGWAGHWTIVEIPLLVSLTSPDSELRTLAVLCFQRAATIQQAMLALGFDEEKMNPNVIQLFAQKFSGEGAVFSADTQQSQCRSALATLSEPTSGLLVSWDEAMRRWKELASVIFSRVVDDDSERSSTDGLRREQIESTRTPEQQFEEWTNLCRFLLAASGVCSRDPDFRLESVISSDMLPSRMFRRVDRAKNADRFVQELVDLLVSDSLAVRDVVKDALGNDLSQLHCLLFFQHLKSIVAHFFDSEKGIPVTEEAFTVFIDQTMAVLQITSDRISGPLSTEANAVLDGLLLSFTVYIQRMGQLPAAYRLKTRLCHLCDSILTGRRPSPADSSFRNKMLEHIVNWASDARPLHSDQGTERLHHELDLACLRCLVPLLDQLIVHSTELETGGNVTSDGRLFSRYFDFFAFTLHRLNPADSARKGKPANDYDRLRVTPGRPTFTPRQYAISALANLVSANADPAYHHLPEMGTTVDLAARSAYLESLVHVVEKKTSWDWPDRAPEDDTYNQLVALIRQPDLSLAMALCEVCTAANFEDLTDVFLKVFDTQKSIAKFLKAVIEVEVSITDHESTLFRGNSFATRILTAYARARGYHYLRNTLKDLLLTLCNKPDDFTIDFDPHRPMPDDDEASHNLEQVTEAFLICISQSIPEVPAAIREICHHIGQVVGDRFPESVFTAIGGFIFLRFINPAIVSPDSIDLDLPPENRDIRRGLVMITKVLQALANNVRFGAKEPGMSKLNDFMDKNIFGMTRFLQSISHYNPLEEPLDPRDANSEKGGSLEESDRAFLHQFLSDNMDKLGMELLRNQANTARHWHDGNEMLSPGLGSRTWEKATAIIAALGPPPDAAHRAASAAWDASPDQAYRTFMLRNEARVASNGSVWGRIFYEVSASKGGLPTFCLLAHRIKAETADLESLVYYILQQLGRPSGPFEVLIDCTRFSVSSEIPTASIVQLVNLLPAAVAQHISRLVVFGCNSLGKRYVRKLSRFLTMDRLDSRRVVTVSSLAELDALYSNVGGILPASTIAVHTEKRNTFSHVTERHQIKVEWPVVFKVGQRTLLISTVKKQDLFSDVRATVEDTIELNEIEEIRKVSYGVEGEGIELKLLGDDARRRFLTSNHRSELLQAINAARNEAPARAPTYRDPSLQPHDVPSILINAVLLNLCSSQETLRGHGYELLCALARAYQLEGLEDFKNCNRLYVPAAHLTFLANVSERLAAAAPTHSLGVISQFALALSSVSPSEGAAYVYCLRPWLHNLPALAHTPRDERDVMFSRLRQFLRKLITISIRDHTLHAMLETRVWPAIGKIDLLIPLILDEGIRCITAFDVGVDPYETVSQILVALSAGHALRAKVLGRLRQAISRTAGSAVSSLSESTEWPVITTLLRLDLALSFDSRLLAQLFLPEVLHITMSVAATGSTSIRLAVQGLLVNTVHSLAKDGAVDTLALQGLLATLSGAKAERLFGLNGEDNFAPWELAGAGEELVTLLASVIAAAAPTEDTANAWRARWISLSTANCFQHNPALQPRAFLVLSALGRQEADGDLVFQMLTCLRHSIRLSPSNDGSLAITIIRALVQTLPGLARDSHFWTSTFWLGVALVQIGHPRITAAAIPLLSAVLEGLDDAGAFKEKSMHSVLLELREVDPPTTVSTQLDSASSVDFRTNFGFALAILLSKPLHHPATTSATIDLIFKLILCSGRDTSPRTNGTIPSAPREVAPDAIAFFLVLLSSAARLGRLEELLIVAGLESDRPGSNTLVGDEVAVREYESAFLAFALLTGLARVADSDVEYAAIFSVLAKLTKDHPKVADHLYDSLAPTLNTALHSSASLDVLDAAQEISSSQSGRPFAHDRPDVAKTLAKLGFPNLLSRAHGVYSIEELAGEITPHHMDVAALVAALILEALNNPRG